MLIEDKKEIQDFLGLAAKYHINLWCSFIFDKETQFLGVIQTIKQDEKGKDIIIIEVKDPFHKMIYEQKIKKVELKIWYIYI